MSSAPTVPGQPVNPMEGKGVCGVAGEGGEPDGAPQASYRRRRLLAVAVVATAALVAVGGWLAFDRWRDDGPPPLPPGAVPIDVWAPYWTLDDTLPVVDQRLDSIGEVSPFWYSVGPALDIQVDEFVPTDAAAKFIEAVADSHSKLVPSIRDELPAGDMAAILADPNLRARHIEELIAFAQDNEVDGLDLDYEQFAFADDRVTWEVTRGNWVNFIAELAAQLHELDITLTVSIPPIYDPATTGGDRGYWVYDHGAIAEHVDSIRVMAYDYSVAEPGPIAPISWVRQSIDGVSAAVPEELRHKLVLGVPSYGTNWVLSTAGECPETAEGRTNVTARTALDLAAKRGATPGYDPTDHEWSFTYDLEVTDGTKACTQKRLVRWIDAEGAAERVKLARYSGWGGVALWAFGYEDDEVWTAIVDAAHLELPATPSSSSLSP